MERRKQILATIKDKEYSRGEWVYYEKDVLWAMEEYADECVKAKRTIPVANASRCPKCGAPEIEAMTPRTKYKCGSSDYDQRPNTFKQTIKCRIYALFNWH